MDEPFLTHLLKLSLKVFRFIRAANRVSPSSPQPRPEERGRQFATLHCGCTAALSNAEPDLSVSLFIFVAQRIVGAREILEAGPLAEAERSSEERQRRVDCLSRP